MSNRIYIKHITLCSGSCRTLFIARSSLIDGVTCSMVCMSVLASAVVDLMQCTKSGDAFVNVKPCVSCETFRGEERILIPNTLNFLTRAFELA